MREKDEGVAGAVLLVEPPEAPFLEVEELRALVSDGRERGYLTFEEIAACLEEVEVTKEQVRDLHAHLVENGVELVAADGVKPSAVPPDGQTDSADGPPAPRQEAGDRPHGRAEPRLAAALPAIDRSGGAAHGRRGGVAGQAHRARRHDRQAAHGGGQPATGGVDREGLPGTRPVVPRPDPGGLARARSARSRSSTTAAATSSRPTPRGGSARRSRARSPTRRARSASPCTWSRS